MKKISTAFVILIIGILSFSGCEKDDICTDGDEPLLVIRFYDASDTDEYKDVTNLEVKGVTETDTLDVIDNADLDSIALPLRATYSYTSFLISRQESNEDTENIDVLTFSYETNSVYISRACGYVANYENLSDSLTTDSDNWIESIEVVNTTVENSDSAHVKIYH
ncbi:DUF6452 family protein [Maribacter polysaccharolyticus]|uniref:DUF6452 family protein n=1 Tax=Maribacter polysaccharolyticus TaxID=3020831 RepID=UPI00237EEBCF|nr:DUF6452 family protein [Maribacter polysaccharolyticus]MDE3743771.1 DUF6452 family protein [Maribacter polysaccharolyticus]